MDARARGTDGDLFGDARFVKDGDGVAPWVLQFLSDNSPGYGGVAWNHREESFTFADLWELSTDFNPTDDDLRRRVENVTVNDDALTSPGLGHS